MKMIIRYLSSSFHIILVFGIVSSEKCGIDSSCSYNRNVRANDDATFKDLEDTVYSLTKKQLEQLQQIKEILLQSNESLSYTSHLEELEKQIVKIQSLFGDSDPTVENEAKEGFGTCTSALETFYTRVSKAAENNRKSIEELRDEREKFEEEKEEEFARLKEDYKQEIESAETSLKQTQALLDEVNEELETIKESYTNGKKHLEEKISQVETSVLSKACNCPSTDLKILNISEQIENSKVFQDDINKEMQKNLNEQKMGYEALEKEFMNQQKELQELYDTLINDNDDEINEKISSLENSVSAIETKTAKNISELENSINEKACNCPAVNEVIEELQMFKILARKILIINRIFVIDGSFTWDQAEIICKVYGATLVSIPDAMVQVLAQGAVEPIMQTGAWMGLKSNGRTDGIFQWNNGMTINSKNKKEGYQYWQPENPEDYPKGPVCGTMLKVIAFGRWSDNPCDMKLAALCELPI